MLPSWRHWWNLRLRHFALMLLFSSWGWSFLATANCIPESFLSWSVYLGIAHGLLGECLMWMFVSIAVGLVRVTTSGVPITRTAGRLPCILRGRGRSFAP